MTRRRPTPPVFPLVAPIAALLVACSSPATTPTSEPEPEVSASPSAAAPSSAPSVEPSASASASAAPSAVASETPPSTGGGFELIANPEADALFLDRDACENRRDGYRLQFPDDWYTNTEYRDYPPCVWFSPTDYDTTGDEVPPEVAITIEWVPGDVGSFQEELSREEGEVSLQPAVRMELAGSGTDGSEFPPEWRAYRYVIQLGPTPEEGPNLVVTTTNEMGGDYELNKAVLDRLMATIEFIGTTQ
jgi:hypothetical protein